MQHSFPLCHRHFPFVRSRHPSIVAALLLLCATASAQESVRIGPTVAYSFGVPLGIDRAAGVITSQSISGESFDHAGRFGASVRMPGWPFGIELGLGTSFGEFTSEPYMAQGLFDSTSNRLTVRSTTTFLQLDLPFLISSGWFHFSAGPTLGFRITGDVERHDTILEPSTARFPDGSRSRIIPPADSLLSAPFRLGLRASIGTELSFGESIAIPQVDVRADAGALVDGLGVRALRIGVGLSLLLPIEPAPAPPVVENPPPPIVPVSTTRPRLDASLQLYTGDARSPKETAEIERRVTTYRQIVSMLPAIYFDRGSDAIPSRYRTLDRSRIDSFSNRDLARLDAVGIYHHLLDIVGSRLRDEPNARLTISGGRSSDEPGELGRARAETIRRYLRDVWGIEESRLATRTIDMSGNRDDESRVVTLRSTSSEVMAPLTAEWRVKENSAPPIGLSRAIRADAGLRRWELKVTHEGDSVAYYQGTTEEELNGIDVVLHAGGDDTQKELAPLVAELRVEDSSGGSATARDSLRLIWRLRLTEGNARPATREILTATVASGIDRGAISATVRQVAAMIQTGAGISIGSGGNASLRDQVMADLMESLRQRSIYIGELHLEPIDEPRDPLPVEEQLLRSGVRVVVEQ